jgi:hypothetical protein
MPREQLKPVANSWQNTQVPAEWAGAPIDRIEIHLLSGEVLVVGPTEWVAGIGSRLVKMTDQEHTQAFEPWVDPNP